MKTNELYWSILHGYFEGQGLKLSENNMSKADIKDFALFCMKYLKENIAQVIIADILSRVDKYREDEL